MGCEELKDLIPLYAGGEAHDNERLAVEAHLPLCPECSREVEQYREMRGLLTELRDGPLPPGTEAQTWKVVRNELFPHRGETRVFDWVLRSAAVLVIGLAIGFFAVVVGKRAPTPQAPSTVQTRNDVVDVARTSVGGADFAGSSRNSGVGEWTFPDEPSLKFTLPRPSQPDGSHYLPRVEAIVADGERDF